MSFRAWGGNFLVVFSFGLWDLWYVCCIMFGLFATQSHGSSSLWNILRQELENSTRVILRLISSWSEGLGKGAGQLQTQHSQRLRLSWQELGFGQPVGTGESGLCFNTPTFMSWKLQQVGFHSEFFLKQGWRWNTRVHSAGLDTICLVTCFCLGLLFSFVNSWSRICIQTRKMLHLRFDAHFSISSLLFLDGSLFVT